MNGRDGMGLFLGTKALYAKPMTRGEYNLYRGWSIPADESPDDAGFLVEYLDGGKPNHSDHAGYISWSPADVFQRSYHPAANVTFGEAVAAMKLGERVARAGWNGKGMFLYYVPAASYPAQRNGLGTMVGRFPDDMVPYAAYIAMKTAQDNVVPWLASQTDILSEDWLIVRD